MRFSIANTQFVIGRDNQPRPKVQITNGQLGIKNGAVMLEFVLVFPVFFVVLMGVIQFAHLWIAKQVVHYAAYAAARAALVSVCDEGGPSIQNDSWPATGAMPFAGLRDEFPLNSIAWDRHAFARTEAEYMANHAAAQVCSWIAMGSRSDIPQKDIPGWGEIPASSAAYTKTRAIVRPITIGGAEPGPWVIEATVEHDFALIVPVVGAILAWSLNPWDDFNPFTESPDITGNVHLNYDAAKYPHLRLTETVRLPKPYRTVLAMENWNWSP